MKQARVSTTDPEARVMKMADGGFRPAYNVQMARHRRDSQVVVGVAVINPPQADQGEGLPMEESFRGRMQRTGCHPGAYLVDGGFVDLEDIGTLERLGVQVYAPPKRLKDSQGVSGKPGTKPGVLAWRERMETEEGRTIYQHRASTAECVNALAGRGMEYGASPCGAWGRSPAQPFRGRARRCWWPSPITCCGGPR